MRTYITTLMLVTALALVACGGGNDVASSGASAVSAAASTSTNTPTEAKLNGQIDERTGVAPVVAQMTLAQTVTACTASTTYGGTGPLLTATTAPTLAQCATALPNAWTVYSNSGCGQSLTFGNYGTTGPYITPAQQTACINAVNNSTTTSQCNALGGIPYNLQCFMKGSGLV